MSVPTWEINGKLYSGERDLDELEEIVKAELGEPTASKSSSESSKASEEKPNSEVKAKEETSSTPEVSKNDDTAPKIAGSHVNPRGLFDHKRQVTSINQIEIFR